MSRRLGQHFLADGSIAARIVRAGRVSHEDHVVEVGPGRGALTHLLVQAEPAELVLVELDPELAAALRHRFSERGWVRVVEADARSVDPAALAGASARYKLIGNLPYYAASPILRQFLESERRPDLIVIMVQKEVAQEMAAGPGEMGLLSIAVQLFANAEVLFDVPPSAFRPPPRVSSSVVRLNVLSSPRVEVNSVPAFFEIVRAGFRAPRKQVRNSLALGLDVPGTEAEAILEAAGIDSSRRPATLAIEEWGAVLKAWSERRLVVPGARK